jgi:hypothetical protein
VHVLVFFFSLYYTKTRLCPVQGSLQPIGEEYIGEEYIGEEYIGEEYSLNRN